MTTSPRGHTGGWLLLVFAVAQVAMTLAIQVFGGRSPGGRGAELWISPAPYAFGIWGVIYLLCVVHAVAVVRHGSGVADHTALITALSVLYVASALWSVTFALGVGVAAVWALVGVLVAVRTESVLLLATCALGIVAVAVLGISRQRQRAGG